MQRFVPNASSRPAWYAPNDYGRSLPLKPRPNHLQRLTRRRLRRRRLPPQPRAEVARVPAASAAAGPTVNTKPALPRWPATPKSNTARGPTTPSTAARWRKPWPTTNGYGGHGGRGRPRPRTNPRNYRPLPPTFSRAATVGHAGGQPRGSRGSCWLSQCCCWCLR